MLRVAFFGTDGEFSCRALAGLETRHALAVIVAPPAPGRPLRSMLRSLVGRPTFSLSRLGRRLGAPISRVASGTDAAALAAVVEARADVVCLAGYPWVLPPEVFQRPRLGAINLHASLLPRHRGILPLFWIYYHDDRDTGVTVHRVAETADSGPILGQARFALPRGFAVDRLNSFNAERGGVLMASTLDALERGAAHEHPQDESLATPAPRVAQGARMVDFEHWGAERVWHFLAGLFPWFQEPLVDGTGKTLRYRGVAGFSISQHDRRPGRIERVGSRLTLYCRDGIVELW